MKNKNIFILSLITLFLFGIFSATPLFSEEKKNNEFWGSFNLGYRFVDVNESETKYKEDINLQDGIRLFDFNIHYTPENSMKKLFDKMDLSLINLGGEPFEMIRLNVVKYGKYKFIYNRRKSVYFYNDVLDGEDFHTFNFNRINDSGLLKISINKKSGLYVDFNRYTKVGESTNSLDINRVEFEFDKPIDEKATNIAIGFDYSTSGFSLLLEEKFQDYTNANSFFLPGYADGGSNARYPSAMEYFYLNLPYDMKGFTHTVKVSLKPFKKLYINAGAKIIDQDTDISYDESAGGTDLYGADFSYDNLGKGSFSRNVQLLNADFTYLLGENFALVFNSFLNNFDQNGSLTVDGEKTPMELKYKTGGFEGGIQYQPKMDFGVTFGLRYEAKDVTTDEYIVSGVTDASSKFGFFGKLKWKVSPKFKMTGDYQFGTYDTPLTLIAPTEYHRFRITGKYHSKSSYLSLSYLLNKSKSDQAENIWKSDKNQLNLRFGIYKKKIKFSTGYTLIDVSRSGNRTIYYPPSWSGEEGSVIWDILFDGSSNLFDVYLYKTLNDSTGLGGYFNYYKNNGSWELERTNMKLFFRYLWKCGFISQLNYRYVDFKENSLGYNNYKANIFEISLGYKWH